MATHNTRITQTMASGIPLVLGLRTRVQGTHVWVVFWPLGTGGFLRLPIPVACEEAMQVPQPETLRSNNKDERGNVPPESHSVSYLAGPHLPEGPNELETFRRFRPYTISCYQLNARYGLYEPAQILQVPP